MIGRIFIAPMLLILTGCALSAPEPNVKKDTGAALIQALLPPASFGGSLSLSQLIVGEFQDQQHSLHVEVEVTPARLVVVALTTVGVPIFMLEQIGTEITVETLGDERLPFDPRHMLSDFQIAYWPKDALAAAFQAMEMTLRGDAADGLREVLSEDNAVLVAVTYPKDADRMGDIVIEHFDPPYRLQIKTFESSESR